MISDAERAAKQGRRARKQLRGPLRGLDNVFEDELLRITRTGDINARQALLVFTGIGEQIGKLAPEEFVGSADRADTVAYFITDKGKSWFNAFPPEKVTDILKPLLVGKVVRSLGNSMGGYGAIWISRYLDVDVAVAFGAQYSVHSAIVPDETRWLRLRAAISEWRAQSLEDHFVSKTKYVTISGSEDNLQWSLFPDLNNAKHFILQGVDHNVPSYLKRTGQLRNALDSAFDGRYDDLAKFLGPMCYERGQEPPVADCAPVEAEPHEAERREDPETIERRKNRAAIRAERFRLMTPDQIAAVNKRREARREARRVQQASN